MTRKTVSIQWRKFSDTTLTLSNLLLPIWEQINLVPPDIMLRRKRNFCDISVKNALLESHPEKTSDKLKMQDIP